MSGRVGVELTPTVVRVVRLAPFTRHVAQTIELPWDPQRPADVVSMLRAKVGRPSGITLAVGLGFLHVMRVDLPPLRPDERTRIIELEPDRFFAAATSESLVATVAPEAQIAFAASSGQIESLITAFEAWAPVDWVEPAPVAVARILAGQRDGAWRLESAVGETGVLHLEQGRITAVRRARSDLPGDARPIPPISGVPTAFGSALGAARWMPHVARGAPALAPDSARRRLAARRRATVAASALAAFIAVVFAVWAVDRWRERTLDALDRRIADLEVRTAPAESALRVWRSREMEANAIREITATRADPFHALASISAALPREASVLSARASGNDWQIDGTTSDASTLVPLFDRRQDFDSVRFLAASSRFRELNRSYETFSIALRYRPQP